MARHGFARFFKSRPCRSAAVEQMGKHNKHYKEVNNYIQFPNDILISWTRFWNPVSDPSSKSSHILLGLTPWSWRSTSCNWSSRVRRLWGRPFLLQSGRRSGWARRPQRRVPVQVRIFPIDVLMPFNREVDICLIDQHPQMPPQVQQKRCEWAWLWTRRNRFST